MGDKPESKVIQLSGVRLAFPALFQAESYQDGPAKFGGTFLMAPDSENAKKCMDEIQRKAKEKWGEQADSVLQSIKGNPNKMCLISGDSKPDLDGFPGNLYVRATNKIRPGVVQTVDGQNVQVTEQDGVIYGGCFVNVNLEFWVQDNQYGKGVRCTLLGVQYASEGDRFSGGAAVSSPDDFGVMSDGADAPAMGEPQASSGGGGFV